jgi:hypothetical protein
MGLAVALLLLLDLAACGLPSTALLDLGEEVPWLSTDLNVYLSQRHALTSGSIAGGVMTDYSVARVIIA